MGKVNPLIMVAVPGARTLRALEAGRGTWLLGRVLMVVVMVVAGGSCFVACMVEARALVVASRSAPGVHEATTVHLVGLDRNCDNSTSNTIEEVV